MESKICTKCHKDKSLSEFFYDKNRNKHTAGCKSCKKEYALKNKEKISSRMKEYFVKTKQERSLQRKNFYKENKEEILNSAKQQYQINKEKKKKQSKKYYQENKIERKEKNREIAKKSYKKNKDKKRQYSLENREKRNYRARERRKNDILFYIRDSIRVSIYHSFKCKNLNKSNKTSEILGCSIPEFKSYIENQFEPWMNWQNHGMYDKNRLTWQLDHKIPASLGKTKEELIKLNHHTNFQPLESMANILKSNKTT